MQTARSNWPAGVAAAVVAVELFMLSLKVNQKCLAATGIWRPEPKARPRTRMTGAA